MEKVNLFLPSKTTFDGSFVFTEPIADLVNAFATTEGVSIEDCMVMRKSVEFPYNVTNNNAGFVITPTTDNLNLPSLYGLLGGRFVSQRHVVGLVSMPTFQMKLSFDDVAVNDLFIASKQGLYLPSTVIIDGVGGEFDLYNGPVKLGINRNGYIDICKLDGTQVSLGDNSDLYLRVSDNQIVAYVYAQGRYGLVSNVDGVLALLPYSSLVSSAKRSIVNDYPDLVKFPFDSLSELFIYVTSKVL